MLNENESVTQDIVFNKLPNELLLHIFSFFNPRDKGKMGFVCKLWQQVSSDNQLWKSECEQAGFNTIGDNYKKTYIKEYNKLVNLPSFYIYRQHGRQDGNKFKLVPGHVLYPTKEILIQEVKESFDGRDISILGGGITIPGQKLNNIFIFELKLTTEQMDKMKTSDLLQNLNDKGKEPIWLLNHDSPVDALPEVPIYAVYHADLNEEKIDSATYVFR